MALYDATDGSAAARALDADTNADADAAYCTPVLQGMAVRARDGASQTEPDRAPDLATASWDVVTGTG
ncbi:hypothetical protein HW130_23130 [Streptomyces sp. PKU-EA00015]|uniref:hypothetical protein n=1 Tax=Streptomyces sp. PKU-EA00015 TaxID=2748326 RepID=UPI0015A09516|nr:hypothetical protein [Streptomyces sp. PKU-EA00015]NWF29114.1 hypothetical protein [Streptomyces sp. PKU-EA00015]